MASSETIMVSRPKGKGSNGLIPGTKSRLINNQTINQTALRLKKRIVPNFWVSKSATFSTQLLLRFALALMLLMAIFSLYQYLPTFLLPHISFLIHG